MTGGEICSSIAHGQPRKGTHGSWSQQALGGSMGLQRQKWQPEDPEMAPGRHGATKPSVAPWVVKTKMAPRGPGKDARGSWSHQGLFGSMALQEQNGTPKTRKTSIRSNSISYAKPINIICNYNLWSTHRGVDVPFQFHPNRRRRPI